MDGTAPALVAAVLSFSISAAFHRRVLKEPVGKDVGHPKLDFLAAQIKDGAKAFLAEEYKYLTGFIAMTSTALLVLYGAQEGFADGASMAVAFVVGAGLSALTGWTGMMVATDGNVRTTVACTRGSLNDGLKVAFYSGASMGFNVVAFGLFGLSATFAALKRERSDEAATQLLSGFGFGASSIALFARVAGGIYTKAADVGADLVGKVEAGIDEDDPHNPAVIADNVGDNVGDVAGMGADLFESYVGSIIAAATLGAEYGPAKVALPFHLAAAGVACSTIGCAFVSTEAKGAGWNVNLGHLMWAMEKGILVASATFAAVAYVVVYRLLESSEVASVYGCVVIGLACGVIIGKTTEYFTSFDYGPVQSITARGLTGPGTVVIQGLGVGMISTVPIAIELFVAIVSCSSLGGGYGVAIAAVGMLATLGITLATDAYGPVADNAGGLAEMAGLDKSVRDKTDSLDALGNTTAATGKGFAIGSAVLTALSLLAAFKQQVNVTEGFDVTDAVVLAGVLLGAMLPYLFAALTMISVAKAAAEIIVEVRRQFREVVNEKGCTLGECIRKASQGIAIPPEEDVMPDSNTCVKISTRSSVREMVAPGAFAVLSPVVVGLLVGPRCLAGVLAGCVTSGCMSAVMMSNAGGAWDNSKKLCEKLKIKKTEQGKACIVGDTVGDPFKDTSGPALNILIKLISIVSLTLAPVLRARADWEGWTQGILPVMVTIGVTWILYSKKILTWEDPMSENFKKSTAAVEIPAANAHIGG